MPKAVQWMLLVAFAMTAGCDAQTEPVLKRATPAVLKAFQSDGSARDDRHTYGLYG
jgi:hypothetical protein